DKAIAILEGKIPHGDSARMALKRKTAYKKYLPFVIIGAAVLVVDLVVLALIADRFYQKGLDESNATLALAHRDIKDKAERIDGLVKDLNHTKQQLDDTSQQKDRLTQKLQDTRDSIARKINAVKRPLKDKIELLADKSQKQIFELNNR